MEDKDKKPVSTPAQMPVQKKIRRFGPPEEFAPELGVMNATADHVQGIVSTQHLPKLFEAFAVSPRNGMTFPFQYILKQHGEFPSLRVEASELHGFEDTMVQGHQWAYHRDQPGHLAQAL